MGQMKTEESTLGVFILARGKIRLSEATKEPCPPHVVRIYHISQVTKQNRKFAVSSTEINI